MRRRAWLDGALTVFVAVDGEPAGALLLEDRIRPDARQTIRALRRGGITRIVLATGDRAEAASVVGALTGVDEVLAELTPDGKLDAVRREQRRAAVIMTGDGINDAPALALADVGVAMGARGSTASSEAADAVLTVDHLGRLGEAAALARRTRRIALQSVLAGMGLSLAAMGVAAAGLLPGGLGRAAAGGHRRGRHPERAARAAAGGRRRAADRRGRRPHPEVPRRAPGHPGATSSSCGPPPTRSPPNRSPRPPLWPGSARRTRCSPGRSGRTRTRRRRTCTRP